MLRWKLKHLSFLQAASVLVQGGARGVDGLARVSPPAVRYQQLGRRCCRISWLGEGAEGWWIFLSVSSFTNCWRNNLCQCFPSGRTVQNIPAQAALKEKVPGKQEISVWAFWLLLCSHLLSSCALWPHPLIPPLSLHSAAFLAHLCPRSAVKGVWHLLLFPYPLLFLPWICLQLWNRELAWICAVPGILGSRPLNL